MPRVQRRQPKRHQDGTNRNPDTPTGMEPLHQRFTKMRCHIRVQTGVNRPRTQPGKNPQRYHHPPVGNDGITDQRHPGQQTTCRQHPTYPQPREEEPTEETRNHIAGNDRRQQHPNCIKWNGKTVANRWPANTEQAIGQTEGNEGNKCQHNEAYA